MKIFAFDNKILALNNKWLRESPIDANSRGLPDLTTRVASSTTNAVQGQTEVYDSQI